MAQRRQSQLFILLVVLLLIASVVVYFGRFQRYPLLDPDEGRYAEIPREMLESGDFVTPRLNYFKYFEKPPLFYWFTAGMMAMFGQTPEAARLAPQVVGLLTVALTVAFGTAVLGRRAGLLGGWALLTAISPFIAGRLLVIDGLFSLLLAATWACWWTGYSTLAARSSRRWFLCAWVCLALAVLAKGLAAIVLTGLLIFAFIALRRDWSALRRMAWWPGLLVFLIIAVPWHIMAAMRNPEFLHYYIVAQHFMRFTGERPEHVKPWYFFPATLPMGMGAWALVSILALIAGMTGSWGSLRRWSPIRNGGVGGGEVACGRPSPPIILYLTLWVIVVVGFFSLSTCKLVPYIWPAYPALSLLVGWYFARDAHRGPLARVCSVATAAVIAGTSLMLPQMAAGQDVVPPHLIRGLVLLMQIALFAGAAFLLLSVWQWRLAPLASGLAWLLVVPLLLLTLPIFAEYKRGGMLWEEIGRPPLPAEVRIAEWGNYNQSISFYTHKRVTMVGLRDELWFGIEAESPTHYYVDDIAHVRQIAGDRPFVLCMKTELWEHARGWGWLQPAAANNELLIAGNEQFFQIMGLAPWPSEAVTTSPLLLRPMRR